MQKYLLNYSEILSNKWPATGIIKEKQLQNLGLIQRKNILNYSEFLSIKEPAKRKMPSKIIVK